MVQVEYDPREFSKATFYIMQIRVIVATSAEGSLSVCLSVCPLDYPESCERILMTFAQTGRDPRNNRVAIWITILFESRNLKK